MALIAYLEEIVNAMQQSQHPKAALFIARLNNICNEAAAELISQIPDDVTVSQATWEDGRVGLALRPTRPDQPIPEVLAGIDDNGWLEHFLDSDEGED